MARLQNGAQKAKEQKQIKKFGVFNEM